VKVVILCGGMSARLREDGERRPRPMVEVGNRPLLWHIMKGYALHGFKEFVLALGEQGDEVKDYFLNYTARSADFTVRLGKVPQITAHGEGVEDWTVTLADTGRDAMSGARIKRVERYVDGREFMVTYGDAVSDVDVKKLLAFHRAHGRIGTGSGVLSSSAFGRKTGDTDSTAAPATGSPDAERSVSPVFPEGRINGGFFVFKRDFFNYLGNDDSCVLEREPLEHLREDGELQIYPHDGFWKSMDSYRDWQTLDRIWASGTAPWKTWK
jgi:glucose-1-phosphate cytidylyltransferase